MREPTGEDYVADPRERALRIVAQMIDKPLTVALMALALGAAVKGPGMLVPGYQPSGWFSLGLWLSACVAIRLGTLGLVARFRAATGTGLTETDAPAAAGGDRTERGEC